MHDLDNKGSGELISRPTGISVENECGLNKMFHVKHSASSRDRCAFATGGRVFTYEEHKELMARKQLSPRW